MIAAILAADGRDPVHNRAGSNMTWGVATALLEQRGERGALRGRRGLAAAGGRSSCDPRLIVLGNLFRDQLDRYGEMEALADEWAKAVERRRRPRPASSLNADDPLIADLGRDRDASARARASLYFGIEDHSPGAAGAAARLRRQALPPLRAPLRLRARLRRPPRPLLAAPTAAPSGRGPTSPRREIELRGHGGLGGRRCGPRPARSSSSCPFPASTTSTTRWRRSPPAIELGVDAGADRRGAGAGCGPPSAGSRRSRSATAPVSILLIKNPAGANEVLRTLQLEAGERRAGSTSGSRSTTGSPTAATSPGSGTPTSSCSPAPCGRVVCAGTRAPEMALRLKYAGWPQERDRGRAGDRGLARRGGRRRCRSAALRPPHLHRAAGAAQAARRPRPGEGVLAVSERPARLTAAIWHDVECGCLRRRPAALGGARRPLPAARSLELGCGHRPGRPAPRPARPRGGRRRQRPGAAGRALERARPPASPVDDRCSPTPAASSCATPVGAGRWRRCSSCSCSPDRDERLALPRPGRRPAARRAAASRPRSSRAMPRARRARSRSLPDVREVDGWVYSSLPLEALVGAERDRRPPAAPDRLAGRRADRGAERDRLAIFSADQLRARGRGRRAGWSPSSAAAIDATDDHVGSTVVVLARAA